MRPIEEVLREADKINSEYHFNSSYNIACCTHLACTNLRRELEEWESKLAGPLYGPSLTEEKQLATVRRLLGREEAPLKIPEDAVIEYELIKARLRQVATGTAGDAAVIKEAIEMIQSRPVSPAFRAMRVALLDVIHYFWDAEIDRPFLRESDVQEFVEAAVKLADSELSAAPPAVGSDEE